MNETIQDYWRKRAADAQGNPSATTNDIHLRRLEIRTAIEKLKQLDIPAGGRVLDVGCGDGYSTLQVAGALSGLRFTGVDFAESMIDTARKNLAISDDLASRCDFHVGNATKLHEILQPGEFDAATSMRCLINLDSPQAQARAIEQIARCLKPGGTYLAIENFIEGHNAMNDARAAMGLAEIPVRWHNRFFTQEQFAQAAEPYFEPGEFLDFSSSYYFATRVIYSAMCKETGEAIDYDHPIHRLAVDLPWVGHFSPVRLVVLKRNDKPAE